MHHFHQEYARVFKALSDETRLRILDMLSDEELCACHLLSGLSITQPTLSYHMKLLCDCGLVNGRKDGSWMKYTINTQKMEELACYFTQASSSKLIKREIS